MPVKKFLKQSLMDLQQTLADRLGRCINKYSVKQRTIGLIVFGALLGTFCLFLLVGIVGTNECKVALKIDSVAVPRSIQPFTFDSLHKVPSKVIDSIQSVIEKLYEQRTY